MSRRLTIVQYGDFREAALNFERGGDEGYYAQRYSVELVQRIAEELDDLTVICVNSDSYEETVGGVHTIGMRLYEQTSVEDLIAKVASRQPSHLMPRSPIVPLIKWSLANKVTTIPILATSFPDVGRLKGWYNYRPIARVFNRSQIQWIGNHNENSAKDLRRIGVDPNKVVPWDWPPAKRPEDFEPKRGKSADGPFRIFYAGRIQETKGIGDCIRALGVLAGRGHQVSLTAAGKGEIEEFRHLARSLGLADTVAFLGPIPHRNVLDSMHAHDAVIVPSQHAYPEGLPMTIYDAYCSRSPLIASDHPMFRSKVVHDQTAIVFRAGDSSALAEAIERLIGDPALYERLSHSSAAAWKRLQLPVKWGELVQRALSDGPEDRAWRAEYCLASGRYD